MTEKDLTVISRIESEIEKIDKKENTIFFFVIDTKGTPSGSLEYIYKLALILSKNEYNVKMLYQLINDEDDEFVGVREWLGNEYADLPHENIGNEDVSVSPSDVLFIPEIFSNIMMQTKKLPCKRVAIMQNYDYVLEQTPMASQWGNFGIVDAISNTELNASLLNEIFPYVKTKVVSPYISEVFGETNEPKKLIINIVCKDQKDINRVIKPFYWKYPMYKWVSFRDLRGFPKEHFAKLLREGVATVWIDEDASFGYSALEAMKSGSIVIAKTSTNIQEWMEGKDELNLSDCCVWFDSMHDVQKIIASVVRSYITDNIPSKISEDAKIALSKYSYEKTEKEILEYISGILNNRKEEMSELITQIKSKSDDASE